MTLKLHQWGPWVLLSESVAARYGKMKGKRAEIKERHTIAYILLSPQKLHFRAPRKVSFKNKAQMLF